MGAMQHNGSQLISLWECIEHNSARVKLSCWTVLTCSDRVIQHSKCIVFNYYNVGLTVKRGREGERRGEVVNSC